MRQVHWGGDRPIGRGNFGGRTNLIASYLSKCSEIVEEQLN